MHPPFQPQQYARPPHTAVPPPPPPLSIPQQHVQQQHQSYPTYNMMPNNIPPPSPSQAGEPNDESNFNLPGPPPISRVFNGKAYALEIVQQPIRARMCGFGDKDRRPISPPPCVRLIIIDADTNKEVDYSKFENLSRFVLMVDLSSLDTSEEKNLVKHTSTSPSISSVTTTSYPATVTAASPSQTSLQNYNLSNIPAYSTQTYASPVSAVPQPPNPYQINGAQHPPYYGNGMPNYGRQPVAYGDSRYPSQYPNGYLLSQQLPPPIQQLDPRGSIDQRIPQSGMLTRNLIGSMSGSAFKLHDLKSEEGLWFVFQDLSIRTEGWFRLKFTFFDLMGKALPEDATLDSLSALAPMLASIYSKPFKVYSAKRFPGVIESTDLSRKFAAQGIKIPIRKDGQKPERRRGGPGSDDDDDDDDVPGE